MALNAKLKKAVDQGLITKAQAELLAGEGKQKPSGKNAKADVPGFFTRAVQVLGGALALGGLSVFTYWANINFAPWGYVLLMLGYVCISFSAFSWLREKGQRLPAALTGFIFTCVVCALLISFFTAIGWLDPHSTQPQWFIAHTVTLVVLAAAVYISTRFSHWLTDINLALSIAGVVSVIIAHATNGIDFFNPTANGLAFLTGGLLTTLATYAWRYFVPQSPAKTTTATHVLAAIYLYIGLATLEPGINFVPQTWPFLALYALLIIFGAFIQRRAYILAGVVGIVGFISDYLWHWMNNPLLFSFITIGVGLFLIYGVTRAQLLLPSRLAKKLPLPAWLSRN